MFLIYISVSVFHIYPVCYYVIFKVSYLFSCIYVTCPSTWGRFDLSNVYVSLIFLFFFFHVNRVSTSRSRSSGTRVAAIQERAGKPLTLSLLRQSWNRDAYRLGTTFRPADSQKGSFHFPLPKTKASESKSGLSCILGQADIFSVEKIKHKKFSLFAKK